MREIGLERSLLATSATVQRVRSARGPGTFRPRPCHPRRRRRPRPTRLVACVGAAGAGLVELGDRRPRRGRGRPRRDPTAGTGADGGSDLRSTRQGGRRRRARDRTLGDRRAGRGGCRAPASGRGRPPRRALGDDDRCMARAVGRRRADPGTGRTGFRVAGSSSRRARPAARGCGTAAQRQAHGQGPSASRPVPSGTEASRGHRVERRLAERGRRTRRPWRRRASAPTRESASPSVCLPRAPPAATQRQRSTRPCPCSAARPGRRCAPSPDRSPAERDSTSPSAPTTRLSKVATIRSASPTARPMSFACSPRHGRTERSATRCSSHRRP